MQDAILCFRDYQNKELISPISQGQKVGTHILLTGANDWAGRTSSDRVDLLAPFDCEVMAIARGDNTVFFQSLDSVRTPTGILNSAWLMCTHMLDSDFNLLGIKVGKTFQQGEPIYTEGKKGIGSGYHIHMEQGYGTFGGGDKPYYRSTDTYVYDGDTYYQYYPQVAKGGKEMPCADFFFYKDVEIVYGASGKSSILDYYPSFQKYVPIELPKTVEADENKNQINVQVTGLRIRTSPEITGTNIVGYCEEGYYDVDGIVTNEYTWYQIDDFYVASVDGVTYLPKVSDPKIKELETQVKTLTKQVTKLETENTKLTDAYNKLLEEYDKTKASYETLSEKLTMVTLKITKIKEILE